MPKIGRKKSLKIEKFLNSKKKMILDSALIYINFNSEEECFGKALTNGNSFSRTQSFPAEFQDLRINLSLHLMNFKSSSKIWDSLRNISFESKVKAILFDFSSKSQKDSGFEEKLKKGYQFLDKLYEEKFKVSKILFLFREDQKKDSIIFRGSLDLKYGSKMNFKSFFFTPENDLMKLELCRSLSKITRIEDRKLFSFLYSTSMKNSFKTVVSGAVLGSLGALLILIIYFNLIRIFDLSSLSIFAIGTLLE